MIDNDYLDDRFYDKYQDEDDEEEEFRGFSIIDESGIDISEIKKIVKEAEQDEPTIATPVPQNEQTVIIDNAGPLLPENGEELELKISKAGGSVYYKRIKTGDFKPAFIARLYETREGQYARAVMYSNESPVMVKLIYTECEEKGSVKI